MELEAGKRKKEAKRLLFDRTGYERASSKAAYAWFGQKRASLSLCSFTKAGRRKEEGEKSLFK